MRFVFIFSGELKLYSPVESNVVDICVVVLILRRMGGMDVLLAW